MIAGWTFHSDFSRHYERICARGRLLGEWPGFDVSESPTQCYRDGEQLWFLRADRGAIRFEVQRRAIAAYPKDQEEAEPFRRMVYHAWLPFVYNLWGIQVLHASAAVHTPSGQVIVFSGPSGSGKSTLGYGLGRCPGWQQISDDSLAFSAEFRRVRPVPIPNESWLRPASAAYYGNCDLGAPLDWPAGPLRLQRVYLLEPSGHPGTPLRALPVSRARAFVSLLVQAYTLTLRGNTADAVLLERPEDNPQQMREYLMLASEVPAFRLEYPRRFEALDEVFSMVEGALENERCTGEFTTAGM